MFQPSIRALRTNVPHTHSRRYLHCSSRLSGSAFYQLGALSTSREGQYLSKATGIPRTEFSPALELIRTSEVEPFAKGQPRFPPLRSLDADKPPLKPVSKKPKPPTPFVAFDSLHDYFVKRQDWIVDHQGRRVDVLAQQSIQPISESLVSEDRSSSATKERLDSTASALIEAQNKPIATDSTSVSNATISRSEYNQLLQDYNHIRSRLDKEQERSQRRGVRTSVTIIGILLGYLLGVYIGDSKVLRAQSMGASHTSAARAAPNVAAQAASTINATKSPVVSNNIPVHSGQTGDATSSSSSWGRLFWE